MELTLFVLSLATCLSCKVKTYFPYSAKCCTSLLLYPMEHLLKSSNLWHITCVQELWDREGIPHSHPEGLLPSRIRGTKRGINADSGHRLVVIAFGCTMPSCATYLSGILEQARSSGAGV